MNDSEKEKRSLLKDEYLQAWSVSFSLASAGGAFAAHAPAVLLISAVSAITFWTIEARWKHIQYGFYGRSDAIEKFFQGRAPQTIPLQIDHHWNSTVRNALEPRLMRTMCKPHVALPHVVIAVLTLALYVLASFRVLSV